jgi:hypothetical protein
MDGDDDSTIQDILDRVYRVYKDLFEAFRSGIVQLYHHCAMFSLLTVDDDRFIFLQTMFGGHLGEDKLWAKAAKFFSANSHTGLIAELKNTVSGRQKEWKTKNFKQSFDNHWKGTAVARKALYDVLKTHLSYEQRTRICNAFKNGFPRKDDYGSRKFDLFRTLMCTWDDFLMFCENSPEIVKQIINGNIILFTVVGGRVVGTLTVQQRKYEV